MTTTRAAPGVPRTVDADLFEVVDHRLVRTEVDDFVWIKRGTVIACHGDMKFRLEEVFQSEAGKPVLREYLFA